MNMPAKNIIFIASTTVLLLLVPFVAMLFTDEVNWNLFDFLVAGVLIFGLRLLLDLIIRKGKRYRLFLILITLFLFGWLWAELAVGIFTNWGS